MRVLLISLALLAWPEEIEPPLMVTVPAAVWDPTLMDRPIEVCGHVSDLHPEINEAALFGTGKWLVVDMRGQAELVVGRAACVTGVIRRRDGENERQRRENGLGHTVVSHGASPDFLLYQCHDPASCDRLMRPGPVRDEQLDTARPR